jgi:hypothetical protein
MEVNLDNTYWDRVRGFVSELRVDARWILRKEEDDKPYGSLRIVSHPDLQPGYLRAIFTYVTKIRPKTREEKLQTIEDYQMEITELEVYSISDDIKTENKTYEAPYKELEELFGVKVFEK